MVVGRAVGEDIYAKPWSRFLDGWLAPWVQVFFSDLIGLFYTPFLAFRDDSIQTLQAIFQRLRHVNLELGFLPRYNISAGTPTNKDTNNATFHNIL